VQSGPYFDALGWIAGIGGIVSILWYIWYSGKGHHERTEEDDARAFYDANGHWPDEDPPEEDAVPEPPPAIPVYSSGVPEHVQARRED
jgi:hypothetical protein